MSVTAKKTNKPKIDGTKRVTPHTGKPASQRKIRNANRRFIIAVDRLIVAAKRVEQTKKELVKLIKQKVSKK